MDENFALSKEKKKRNSATNQDDLFTTKKKTGMSFYAVPYNALILLQIQIQIQILAHLPYDGVFHFSCGSRSVLSKELWQFQLKQKCIVLIASYMGMQIYAECRVRVPSLHWHVITAREIRHTTQIPRPTKFTRRANEGTKPTSKRSKMVVTQFSRGSEWGVRWPTFVFHPRRLAVSSC